jgi:hypothetical protein
MTAKWPAPIDHAYIICSETKEPERYRKLKQWFTSVNMDPSCYSFVYFKHGSELNPEEAFKAYNPWITRQAVPNEQHNYNRYNLKPAEVSLGINWAHSAASAVRGGHKVVLMLESDPVFEGGFLDKLAQSMKLLEDKKSDWDFLSIGDGVGLRPKRAEGDTGLAWFPAPGYYHTRTTNAMIFKVDMLRKILSTYFPFAEIIDWELNYQLTRHNSKSYWLDPIIVKNGSCTGETESSL